MKTGAFLCTATLAALTPVSRPDGCGNSWINHDEVKAFTQQEPHTDAEKAAVRFNPTIVVSYGCYPYAAVNAEGQTSKGLKPSGPSDGHCKGSGHGSQVYVRSTWFRDIWAIMYVYYSPKKQWYRGWNHRHGWDHATVWINTPNATTTLAVTAGSKHNGKMFKASEKVGESVKLEFWQQGRSEIMLAISGVEGGKTLPLITWEQLPDKARCSLNEAKWINGEERMPLSDEQFKDILTDDWPFDE